MYLLSMYVVVFVMPECFIVMMCCRLGSLEAAHAAALGFHIDYVIDSLNGGKTSTQTGKSNAATLRAQLLDTVRKINLLKQGSKGTGPKYAGIRVVSCRYVRGEWCTTVCW